MRASSQPLDQELGLLYYSTDTPGTGGRLKAVPEDFVVEEKEVPTGDLGPYLICRMTKRNWDHHRAIREIARRLGISQHRIGFAGTKDKKAVTTQLISLYQVSDEQVSSLAIRDIHLTPVGRMEEQLSLGALAGNHFRIRITGLSHTDVSGQLREVAAGVSQGIPNYVGYQRFGITRPVTHRVGRLLLIGDLEAAVDTFIGWDADTEPLETRNARKEYLASHDPQESLARMPVWLSFERTMLDTLRKKPGDYEAALHAIPKKLAAMFISAYQSYLFNCALSQRLKEGGGLTDPRNGDLLLFQDGKTDRVTGGNRKAAGIHMKRGRCRIAIMMPGRNTETVPEDLDDTIRDLLREHEITPASFERASRLIGTAYNGAPRAVALTTTLEFTQEGGDNLDLSFSLLPGQYATTVCREIMKNSPFMMV